MVRETGAQQITPGERDGSARTANHGSVAVGNEQSALGQPIDIWRAVLFRAVSPHPLLATVVDQDENDIRRTRPVLRRYVNRKGSQAEQKQRETSHRWGWISRWKSRPGGRTSANS